MEIPSDAASPALPERRIRTPLMNQPLGISKAFHDLTSHARELAGTPPRSAIDHTCEIRVLGTSTSVMRRCYEIVNGEARADRKISLGFHISFYQ